MRVLKRWWWLIVLLAVILTPTAWWVGEWCWQNNLHTVVEGEMYRSAQMTSPKLAKTIEHLNIKSVINLRGSNPQREWYRQEIELCRKKGIEHFDVRLSAKKMPTPQQLEQLFDLFKTAPRPMLIHCYGGSDRTGFVSVLYLIAEKNMNEEEAIRQLSLRFGHFAFFGYEESDEFFDFYEKSKLPDFRDWMSRIYPDIYKVQKIENGWKD